VRRHVLPLLDLRAALVYYVLSNTTQTGHVNKIIDAPAYFWAGGGS
jgi:hypothetical protein